MRAKNLCKNEILRVFQKIRPIIFFSIPFFNVKSDKDNHNSDWKELLLRSSSFS